MVKITKHPIVKDNFVYDKSIVKNTVVADKNATEKTKELAAYLKAVAQQDKVIVGHQSDTSSHVRADLPSDGSDIKRYDWITCGYDRCRHLSYFW